MSERRTFKARAGRRWSRMREGAVTLARWTVVWLVLTGLAAAVGIPLFGGLIPFSDWATEWTFYIGWVGQSVFLAMYLSRQWVRYPFTKALMQKSLSIWLLMTLSSVKLFAYGGPRSNDVAGWLPWFSLALDVAITLSIWNQVFALFAEVRDGRRAARRLYGDAR